MNEPREGKAQTWVSLCSCSIHRPKGGKDLFKELRVETKFLHQTNDVRRFVSDYTLIFWLKGADTIRSRDSGRRWMKKISDFRVRFFTEWPWTLHYIVFPIEFLTKPSFAECLALIQWKGASLHWFLFCQNIGILGTTSTRPHGDWFTVAPDSITELIWTTHFPTSLAEINSFNLVSLLVWLGILVLSWRLF